MEQEQAILVVLYVAIAGSSVGLFATADTELTIYLAGVILGVAVTGIGVQLRGGLDQ